MPQFTRPPADGPLHLAVDATGLKVHGEGEWKVRLHGPDRRRVWRKLHLGVDTATGAIAARALTPSATPGEAELAGLLAQVEQRITAVYADKTYDSFECLRAILACQAQPVIPPRKGAAIRPPPRIDDPPPTRGAAVARIAEIGRKAWKEETAYHRRSLNDGLQTGEGSTAVPSPPPLALAKAFSPSCSGRIFPLLSRVMREGLSTGLCASRARSVLSGRYSPDLLTAQT